MRINNNLMAMNTHRQLGAAGNMGAKSMEKLSSGMRINRAGDDAAGLSISEKMRAQIRGLNQASSNAQDGISMIQTAEGALQETEAILQRMRELSVQGSNDTNTAEDREAIGEELKQLTEEIDRISQTTQFNGKTLLNGSLSTQVDSGSELKAGVQLNTNVMYIKNIELSGAKAGQTYTFTAVDNTGNWDLTLSLTEGDKVTSQTINLTDASTYSELDFNELGIKLEFEETSGSGTSVTGENVATELAKAGSNDIVMSSSNGDAYFAIGSNGAAAEKLQLSFDKVDSSTLKDANNAANTLKALIKDKDADQVITDKDDADDLTKALDSAIKTVSKQRSTLGAAQNRLEHTIKNLDTSSENLQAAESRIRDVDMAKEMMEFTKNNILQQAAQAMLAQANQQPQGVLQLLR